MCLFQCGVTINYQCYAWSWNIFNSTETFWVRKGQIGVWDLSERSNKITDYHFPEHQDCCDQLPCFSVMEGWENTVTFFKKRNRLKEFNPQVLRLFFIKIHRNTYSLYGNKYQWASASALILTEIKHQESLCKKKK